MNRLNNYTRSIAREVERRDALEILDRHYFDRTKATRMISGVAISTRAPNMNGTSFEAAGATFSLPVPLLLEHDWARPLGRVIGVETRGGIVTFKAEIANNMAWCDQVWHAIITRDVGMASVEGIPIADPSTGRSLGRWQLTEISIVECGADLGAFIYRAWERQPVVRLNYPSEFCHFDLKDRGEA